MKIEKREIKLYPEVLKTLRETSGYTIAEIAKKLKTSENKIISVEEGKSLFTLNQKIRLKNLLKYIRDHLLHFSQIPYQNCLN